jgi:hemerythrin-like domain-containing protein
MGPLETLFRSHDQLDCELGAHLEAIALGELAEARRALAAFAATLQAHSQGEDELLLPAFAAAGLEEPGCTVDLLTKEHRKLRRLTTEAVERLHEPTLERLDAADRVRLIEACHMLREVLDHHDTRERAALHARMDQALGTEEAAALATACASREAELRAAFIAIAPDGRAS